MIFKRIRTNNLFIFIEKSSLTVNNVFNFLKKRFKKQNPEIFIQSFEDNKLNIYLIFVNRIDIKNNFSIFENLNPSFSTPSLDKFLTIINNNSITNENFIGTNFFLTFLDKKIFNIQKKEKKSNYDCFESHNQKVKLEQFNILNYLSSFFLIDAKDKFMLDFVSSLQTKNDLFYEIFSNSSLSLKIKQKKLENFYIKFFDEKKNKLMFLFDLVNFVIVLPENGFLSYTTINFRFHDFYFLNLSKLEFSFLVEQDKRKVGIRNKDHLFFLKQFSLLILFFEFFKESFASLLLTLLAEEVSLSYFSYGCIEKTNSQYVILNKDFLNSKNDFILNLLSEVEKKKSNMLDLLLSTLKKKTKKVKTFKTKIFALLNIKNLNDDYLLKDLIEQNFKKEINQQFFTSLIFFILETCQITKFYIKRVYFKGFKRIKLLSINPKIFSFLLSNPKTFSFPMLTKPLPWDNKLSGGFLNNAAGNFFSLIKNSDEFFIDLKSKSTLNALNSQQNSLFIVSPYLKIVEKHFVFLTRCFIKEIEYDSEKINTNLDGSIFFFKEGKIYLKTKESFLANNTSDILIQNFSDKRRKLLKFLIILLSAKLLEPFFFRFTLKLDYRLRIYPVADFFSPQGCNFSKSLLQQIDVKITSLFLKKK